MANIHQYIVFIEKIGQNIFEITSDVYERTYQCYDWKRT